MKWVWFEVLVGCFGGPLLLGVVVGHSCCPFWFAILLFHWLLPLTPVSPGSSRTSRPTLSRNKRGKGLSVLPGTVVEFASRLAQVWIAFELSLCRIASR